MERGYHPLTQLGEGTFGRALLVVREELPYVAKLQRYRHLTLKDKRNLAREVQNMRAMSVAPHPHLVRLRESFVDGHDLCIIMDHCNEGDLAAEIAKQRSEKRMHFEEALVKRWLVQLLSGLDYLHSAGILHRDIKPSNLFLHHGQVKLGDLGLSKQVFADSSGAMVHTQCGTPLYVAPEVHMGQPYAAKVDIWSLGVTLFEMMTLNHAFAGADNQQVLRAIVNGKHEPISGGFSVSLTVLLKQMLTVKASQRPVAIDLLDTPYFANALSSGLIEVDALKHRRGWPFRNVHAVPLAEGAEGGEHQPSPLPACALILREELEANNRMLQTRECQDPKAMSH